MNNDTTIHSFAPLLQTDSEILFLGSAPSVLSRQNQFFYGNPTNRFWKILSALYDEDFVHADRATKTDLLQKHHLALSDVYATCEMKKVGSSLDSNIIHAVFQDIPHIIQGTNIRRIFITSKKAYTDFVKHWQGQISPAISVTCLPSPSAANRSVYKTDDDLIAAWRQIIDSN
ncbi:MAG: DNA-deoxyinosine glycosylase [Prevotella sp.]|nr:DNA-deoxyinosine glycosylase [Prevotella sp.]